MKNKKKLQIILYVILAIVIAITIAIVVVMKNNSYAKNDENNLNDTNNNTEQENGIKVDVPIQKQDDSKKMNLQEIAASNENDVITEKIVQQEIDLEFTTQYRENDSLANGKMQTLQEGQEGKQNAVIKQIYKNGELISEEKITTDITKASIDKIVEVGKAPYSSNYVPIVGDTLKATSNTVAIRTSPSEDAEKIVTISKGENVTLVKDVGDWYYVKYDSHEGYAMKNSLTYVNPNGTGDGDENNVQYTKEQLTQNLGFSMLMNRRSNLSLEQFKKVFANDPNDKNKVFQNNAEYFYYAEQQYNINGLFVAAIGIHESGWGTSKISLDKKNLFGFQAYDRSPYASASSFDGYANGIDLVSRVLVKYYLNPKGTPIYNGETALGTYYKGSTISAVNQSYATDKNWANAVYKWMMYLYNKL